MLILVFLTTLLFFVRLALFHFSYGGTFSSTFFFAFLSVYSGGESEETLNTFNIFLTAYQSSFTRGAYLIARAFSFAVGVTRWEIEDSY